jgi:hypothetical protein
MSRAGALLICVAVSTACGRAAAPVETAKPRGQEARMAPDLDSDNLLAISRGASVVSRTAELSLEFSAVQAIDAMSETLWSAPPLSSDETLVLSLAAPTRIEALGASMLGRSLPRSMAFETSIDGRSWRPAITYSPTRADETRPVPPVEARYIRLVITGSKDMPPIIHSIQARGREVAPPVRRSMGGCWEINGNPARFVQDGARISGVIGGAHPTLVDGGTDGRVARLMWRRGPTWGYAVVTMTPDGDALSGAVFHETPVTTHYGQAWFGQRCAAKSSLAALSTGPQQFLERRAPWALFGVVFDQTGAIDAVASKAALDVAAQFIASTPPSARVRIVAHEFGAKDAASNRRAAAARIDALRAALVARGTDLARVELVASGSDRKDTETAFPIQRLLWSRVDLELVKPAS